MLTPHYWPGAELCSLTIKPGLCQKREWSSKLCVLASFRGVEEEKKKKRLVYYTVRTCAYLQQRLHELPLQSIYLLLCVCLRLLLLNKQYLPLYSVFIQVLCTVCVLSTNLLLELYSPFMCSTHQHYPLHCLPQPSYAPNI